MFIACYGSDSLRLSGVATPLPKGDALLMMHGAIDISLLRSESLNFPKARGAGDSRNFGVRRLVGALDLRARQVATFESGD